VGHHGGGIPSRAAAGRYRGTPGGVYRTGGDCDRQRPGPRRTTRGRRRTGRAAAGGHAGGPRSAARGSLRRGHQGSRPAAGRELYRCGPVRPGRHEDGGRLVEQHRPCLPRRQQAKTRRAERPDAGVPDPPDSTDRRLLCRFGTGRRGRPRIRPPRDRRRAGQHRGRAVGRHDRGIPHRTAAGQHRGPAGRVHRTGRHGDRERPGPRGSPRVRRGASRAAPGRNPGRPGRGTGGSVRRSCTPITRR
jgi:hypothetical protein